jgi:hypothetical protein
MIFPSAKFFNYLVVRPALRLHLATVQCNLFRERSDGCLPRATPVAYMSNAVVRRMALVWTPTVQNRMAYYPSPLLTSLLLGIYCKSPLPPTEIWCDDLAVVKTTNKIRSRNRPKFPNETLYIMLRNQKFLKILTTPDISTSRTSSPPRL